MFDPSQHLAYSHPSRNLIDPQQYSTTSSLYQHPTIAQQPPTPISHYHLQGQSSVHGAVTHQNLAPPPPPQGPDLLSPQNQRLRPSCLVHPDASLGPLELRRSNSLNDAMSNPQAQYYPMSSGMGGYQQQQMYGQHSMSQPNYYQGLPHLSGPAYVEPPRQVARPPNTTGYDYPQMQYSQASYPNTHTTSYQPANSLVTPSYSAPPMAPAQYQRSSPPETLPGATVHVVDRAKKPQCWEHGCNGREFSTFSNLLRHQREKSGTAAKSYCPHCGAEFTRTTARNGHMEHGKCKTRRTGTAAQSRSPP